MKGSRFALLLGSLLAGCGSITDPGPDSLADPGPIDGSVDSALSFDGVDDYATTGTAKMPQIERAQTLMLWLKPGRLEGRQCLLVLRRGMESGTALALADGVPVAFNVFGDRDFARADQPLLLGEWHHLAFVFTGDESLMFVDGAQSGEPGPVPQTNRTPTLSFIGSMDGYREMFEGALDEVRVYDRAFSPEEVASAAAGGRAAADSLLVLYLSFDEASGERSYDRSGVGNHASLGDGIPAYMPERVVSDAPGAHVP